LPHIPECVRHVWEPARGGGKMIAALHKRFASVFGSDIVTGMNFLEHSIRGYDAIITNPPYEQAEQFITHAIDLAGFVAMLLRTDFDHAKTRQHLFGQNGMFAKKLILTRRILWFADSRGSPSFNHAWFIWDDRHSGSPVLAYR